MVDPGRTPPLTVTHALGSYPVLVESGALARLPDLVQQSFGRRRVAMIADARVCQLYQSGQFGAASWGGETLTFEPGESSKTRESWARLTDELMKGGFGRDTGLIALGGGVTGDLAGFVAATYMRGVPYLQIPTTLVAMVDASVGGKTGVDTALGKNLVGAFHQPTAVIADPRALATLPEREYRAGLAEAVKHGLIADEAYFAWIEQVVEPLGRRDNQVLTRLVRRSVEIKAAVVAEDERESGRRAILNAGHTVAHALEQASGYQLPHGEAVGLGLIVECHLAERAGLATTGMADRVAGVLAALGLPVRSEGGLDSAALLATMTRDKKNRDGKIRFALPARLGAMHNTAEWTTAVPQKLILEAMAAIS